MAKEVDLPRNKGRPNGSGALIFRCLREMFLLDIVLVTVENHESFIHTEIGRRSFISIRQDVDAP